MNLINIIKQRENIIMAKKDDITLIIAKSFSSQYLTEKECELCKDLTLNKLINDWGLNDIQSSKVLNWRTISNRRLKNTKSCEEITCKN